MAARISAYLSDEAIGNLHEVQKYLEELSGCRVSRSSALNLLLVKGTGLFLTDQKNVRRTVAKYAEGPLMRKALIIA